MAETEQSPESHDSRPKTTHHKHPPPSNSMPSASGRRALASCVTILLLLAGVAALALWLVYRPHNPSFTVVGAALYHLNATSPPFISTSMQFAIATRNPNRRVSILYDKLSAYVSYRSEQITPPVNLPPLFHETKTTVIVSPLLGGTPVPVSSEVVKGLVMDESYGVVVLRVLLGQLRWKAAGIRTRRNGFHVKCDVLVGLRAGSIGQLPLFGAPPCKVDF